MKKQSRLAVLLAAVLACVMLFTGVAFATAATELNATREDVETALSAEEVQAELAYNQLLACTSIDEMYTVLYDQENGIFPMLYSMNEEQLNGAYSHALAIYNPETDDAELYEMVCDGFIWAATDNNIMLLAALTADNDLVISGDNTMAAGTISGSKTWNFENNGTVTLNGQITVGEGATLTINGAGADGSIIKKNFESTTETKWMFVVKDGGKIVLNNVTLDGGAVWDGTVVSKVGRGIINNGIKNSAFVDFENQTDTSDTYEFQATNCTFRNASSDHVIIRFKNSADAKFSGCTVENCQSSDGDGLIQMKGNEGKSEDYRVFDAENSTFQKCYMPNGNGGLIRTHGGTRVNITLTNCTFKKNYSDALGSCILWNGMGSCIVSECTFEDNSSNGKGGAISSEGENMSISNTTFRNNKAADHGGAVCMLTYGLAVKDTGSSIGINVGVGNGCIFEGNRSGNKGGALAVLVRITQSTVPTAVTASVDLGSGYMKNNNATNGGGAVYAGAIDVSTTPSGGNAAQRLSAYQKSNITLNIKSGTISKNSAPNGGAIMVDDARTDNTGINNVVISGGFVGIEEEPNEATINHGGAVYISDGNFSMTGGTVSYNTAENRGGAVFVNGGTFTMSGGTMSNNTASQGGASSVYGGAFTLAGGAIVNNTASIGGAAHVEGGSFTMNGGTMSSNIASTNGGAAYVAGGDFTMTGGTIGGEGVGNTATTNGGAVYVTGGSFKMTDGIITYNSASNNGGAVYVDGSNVQFEMDNGSITHNSATENGGAVYMANGNFTMHHGAVDHNSATNGGAVYMEGKTSTFKMESGNMDQNTASTDGGAIFANGGTLYIGLEDCKAENEDQFNSCSHHTAKGSGRHHPIMQENTAGQRGGGIAIANDGVVHFYCGAATDNVAMYRGTGKNVFMDGGHFYLYDGANVGKPRDPDLVIVGGELHNACENKDYYTLLYYKDNHEKETQMKGLAEYEEVMNLPDGEYFWPDEAGTTKIFVGWTAQGADSGDENNAFVRNKNQYVESGAPVRILDAKTDKDDETGVNTNKIFDGNSDKTLHLYALWAPKTNHITYVDGMTNQDIVGHEDATYQNVKGETGYDVKFERPSQPGYKLDGWYIYQDEDMNANWGWEPVWKEGTTEKTYANLDLDEFPEDQFIPANDVAVTYTVDPLTFGDITLVAKWEEIVVPITYQVVGPEGIGANDPSGDVELGANGTSADMVTEYIGQATGRRYVKSGENVYTLVSDENNTIQGATAIENAPNYKFVDWFTDADCKTEADNDWIIGEVKLLPQPTTAEVEETPLYQTATYYAKFDFNVADLTIVKQGLNGCDSAIIKVTGYNTASDEEQTWYVSLQNGGTAVIKDMKIGSEYTIREVTEWTVYYGTPNMGYPIGALKDGKYEILPYNAGNVNPNTVTITNSSNPDKWLHDENYAINFSGKTQSYGDGK